MKNGKLAVLLLVPALAFAAGALAREPGDQGSGRHDRQVHDQRAVGSDHYRLRDRVAERGNAQDDHRGRPPERRMDPSVEHIGGGRDGRGYHGSGGDRGQGRDRGERDRGRRDDRSHWHGERREWHGHPYWRFDIRLFPRYDYSVWRGGYWHHGWHGGRWGWWWLAGGAWYYYPAPIYPYPDPYVPGNVMVVNNPPPAPVAPAQAPVQYWYHCKAPDGYYPYVPQCPGGWTKVPATPPGAAAQTTASPPPATH